MFIFVMRVDEITYQMPQKPEQAKQIRFPFEQLFSQVCSPDTPDDPQYLSHSGTRFEFIFPSHKAQSPHWATQS
jgi:hypothetical protein